MLPAAKRQRRRALRINSRQQGAGSLLIQELQFERTHLPSQPTARVGTTRCSAARSVGALGKSASATCE